jgi:lipopolysaccharide transport system permease protein
MLDAMQLESATELRPPAQDSRQRIRIEPPRGWLDLGLRELWASRQVAYFLAWRDVKVRYKQTALGVAWAVIQPLLTTVVFTVFFGHVARVSSAGIAYPLFSLAGLLPWTLFSNAVSQASNSLVGNANMVTKIYLPRLSLPLSAVAGTVLDFMLASVVLVAMLAYYGVAVSARTALAPAFFLLALIAATGVGTLLAAVNVRYRDVRFVVPFLLQIWLFASPVAYSVDSISPTLQTIYGLNPMAGAVAGFRWSLVGGDLNRPMLAVSTAVAVVLAAVALVYFRRAENAFADVI